MIKSPFSKQTIVCLTFAFLSILIFSDSSYSQNQSIPDIGTFMRIGSNGSPHLTADNSTLFFRTSSSGVNQLYRLTEDGWPYQLTVFDDGIDNYTVSPDGEMAIIGASVGGSEDAQLFLLNTQTGKIDQLTAHPKVRYGSVIWKSDNSGFYFRANLEQPADYYIYYYDLTQMSHSKILSMEGSNAIADISLDGKYLLMYHAYSNFADDIYLIDIADGTARMVTSGKENVLYDYPYLLADNNTIVMTCNDNPDGVSKLAMFDIASKKLEYLEEDSKWHVEEVTISPNKKYIAWQINEEGYSIIKMWDVEKGNFISPPPVKGIASDMSLSDDATIAFSYASSTSAPDVWIWNWRTPELKKMTHAIYAGIDHSTFIEPKLIKYKSFDGLEIPAFLYLPPNYNGEPVPFVVHAHGGPESQFRPYLQRHFQYLLFNGFGVLAPNVRGSDGYGKEYVGLDNYKNRHKSLKDYKAAVDYLIKNKFTEKGKIGIKGASYGGYVVLGMITEYPDLFSAAIDQVGIANFVSFLENTRSYRRHIREAEYGPLTDPDFLKSISPIHKADIITTPLLVVHGENDPRVPVGEARQIISAISNNGGIVDSLIFPDEGHGIGKIGNRLNFYRKMADFFIKHLSQ